MLDRYHESEQDSELLALRAEVALIDTRLIDVLKRVDTGESSRIWSKLGETYDDVQTAVLIGDETGIRFALAGLGNLLKAGQSDWAAWTDVRSLVQERKALVESERKRLVEAQQMIAVDQAMSIIGLMVDAVRRHVRDDAVLRAVTDEYSRLVGRPSPVAAVSEAAHHTAG